MLLPYTATSSRAFYFSPWFMVHHDISVMKFVRIMTHSDNKIINLQRAVRHISRRESNIFSKIAIPWGSTFYHLSCELGAHFFYSSQNTSEYNLCRRILKNAGQHLKSSAFQQKIFSGSFIEHKLSCAGLIVFNCVTKFIPALRDGLS